jgi:predicted transcriptional regulator
MIHKKHLEYLGLSEKEATVYVELLRSNSLSGIELSRATNIKKATVYLIIESLVSKDLVKEIKVGKRIHFKAESPDQFKVMFDKKKYELESQMKNIQEIIFELKSIERKVGEKPSITYYEGKEAVRESIHEYTGQIGYSPGDDYGIYSYDLIEKIFSKKDIEDIDKKRIENNVKFRAIYTGGNKFIPNKTNQELIKIAQDKFPIESEILIFNDEVKIHTLGKDVFGMSIKNKEFATTMKSLIDYVFSLRK